MLSDVYIYFSLFNLILVFLHRYTYKYYNLLLSSLFISIVSFTFVYITPRRLDIKLPYSKNVYRLENIKLKTVDFVFHHFVLLFVFVLYHDYYKDHKFGYSTAIAILLVLIYANCFQPYNVYKIEPPFMYLAILVTTFLYLLL